MKILVIGSGGRENALVWKLKQSPMVTELFAAPGNPGTKDIATNLSLNSQAEIIEWLKQNPVDLVVVGPDNYLADGIVDEIQNLDIKVFGPTKLASEIEWSKSYAKDLMKEEGIPTASFETFTDFDRALEYIKQNKFPTVIKASGLALGKGVIIAENFEEAETALREIMTDKVFGEAGDVVVIEEYLRGREISTHAFCDGENAVMFPSSQDHKRIFENDLGPNTGGMGTIAPVPWVTEAHLNDVKEKIVLPLLKALKKRGREFRGLLFPGIMITEDGPKVIEFNARFGDPETESYVRILDTDLVDILLSCIDGTLSNKNINWSSKSAATVMCASGGYPGSYEKGKEITGLDKITDNDVVVFHSGTKLVDDKLVTNGGRVLAVTAIGETVSDALSKAYKAIEGILFEGMQYRKDIGKKSI
ncbi:MAG: phosphoribosylamine--glycine ligase [Patescibacteria group bacterium]